MKNVMLDLETLGNGSNAVIIAIGACEFDPLEGLGRTFYANVDAQSCVNAGLTMDASTVMWWMLQSDEARNVFKMKAQPLLGALNWFETWFPAEACVWGNGATFDNVIMANAYEHAGVDRPWKYNADRCYRTLKALFPDVKAANREGTHHNALDDAIHQARHANAIMLHMSRAL